MFTRQTVFPTEPAYLDNEIIKTLRGSRERFHYWAITEFAQQGNRSDAECVIAALNRMAIRDVPVMADDADVILSLDAGTTLFFNHAGSVPASAVIDELEKAVAR